LSSIIELKQVTKNYLLGNRSIEVLKGIDFQLSSGEFVAIMGASGSGKTTLMNIIGLLDRPSSGRFFLDDKPIKEFSDDHRAYLRNQKMGFVFQSFFLLPRLNALQNVELPLIYRGLPTEEIKQKAEQVLIKVGMGEHLMHKPNELSGGQQQRVAVARALVSEPEVILADEPTGSLDSKTGQEVMDLFIKLNKEEGRTIIIVTHDEAVAKQCKRIVHIKDGLIID